MPKSFEPVEVEGVKLSCSNPGWPPTKILVYGTNLEEIRPLVSPQEYHKLKTWQNVCGLTVMSPDKCPSCPHVLRDGVGGVTPGTGTRIQLGNNTPLRSRKGR